MTPARLARATDNKPPSINDWLNGRTKMLGGENATRVCTALRIRAEWLFFGIGPSGLDDRPAAPNRVIPVLQPSQLGAIDSFFSTYASGCGEVPEIPASPAYGPRVFAMTVTDESMAPDFRPGDILIADPDTTPAPGEFVITDTPGATLRKYKPRGPINGVETYELTPINDDYPTIRSTETPAPVVAVVINHIRSLRR
jgi:hypothetical protein